MLASLALPTIPNNRLRLYVALFGIVISMAIGFIVPEMFGITILTATCAALQAPDLRPKLLLAGSAATGKFFTVIALGLLLGVVGPYVLLPGFLGFVLANAYTAAPAMGYLMASALILALEFGGAKAVVKSAFKRKKANKKDRARYQGGGKNKKK